jgi:hypothetical protein
VLYETVQSDKMYFYASSTFWVLSASHCRYLWLPPVIGTAITSGVLHIPQNHLAPYCCNVHILLWSNFVALIFVSCK